MAQPLPAKDLAKPDPAVESIRRKVERDEQNHFLQAFLRFGNEAKALKVAGLTYKHFRRWMQDEDFQTRFELTRLELVGEVEEAAWNAAKSGHFPFANLMLKAHRPERYNTGTEIKHSGTIGIKAEDIVKELAKGEANGAQTQARKEEVLDAEFKPANPAE